MTVDEFKTKRHDAAQRIAAMDAVDGFKDRTPGTILAALKAGLVGNDTTVRSDCLFEAFVMLEDYVASLGAT